MLFPLACRSGWFAGQLSFSGGILRLKLLWCCWTCHLNTSLNVPQQGEWEEKILAEDLHCLWPWNYNVLLRVTWPCWNAGAGKHNLALAGKGEENPVLVSTAVADREVSDSHCPRSISYLCPIQSVYIVPRSCTPAPLKFYGPYVKARTVTVSSVNGVDSAPEASESSPTPPSSLSVFQISQWEDKLDQFGLHGLSRQLNCAWERGEETVW